MDVKGSFKQILLLMANKRIYTRSLSMVMTFVLALQLAVVPVGAAAWFNRPEEESESTAVGDNGSDSSGVDVLEDEDRATEPALKNTYALVI